MTFYAENETHTELPFAWKELFQKVGEAVLEREGCPYEAQVSLILTDNEEIRQINASTRESMLPQMCFPFPIFPFYSLLIFLLSRRKRQIALSRIQEN